MPLTANDIPFYALIVGINVLLLAGYDRVKQVVQEEVQRRRIISVSSTGEKANVEALTEREQRRLARHQEKEAKERYKKD